MLVVLKGTTLWAEGICCWWQGDEQGNCPMTLPVLPLQWGWHDGHSPRPFEETGFSPLAPFADLPPAAGFVSAPAERDRLSLSFTCPTPHQPTFSGHLLTEQSPWHKFLTPSC